MADSFLQVKNITKSFSGVQALKGVDLTINQGEIRCLAGENGCGKSTLIKAISGAHKPTSGEIIIDGKSYDYLTPIQAIQAGIQVIYQDFSIFPNLTVAENIAMNYELANNKKFVNWKEVREVAKSAMDRIGINIDLDVKVERLSVANKQLVAICRALLNNARLIIMDEPTTALTKKEVERLFEIVRQLQSKGIAILIVNHKLDEVYEIAQTMTIFRNGEKVADGDVTEFDRERFVYCMTGRHIAETYFEGEEGEETILKLDHLSRKDAFEDINIEIKKGEILGITGLLGSGRGEIGEALFGIAPPTSGSIYLDGNKIEIKNVEDAVENGIAYVPEDRLTQGLFLERSIGSNTVVSSLKSYASKMVLNHKSLDKIMHKWVKDLSIAAPSPYPAVKTLSGGNQQKVVLAKWLNTNPKLLILNGPTVGVDIGSKTDIHMILRNLARNGVGVIIISDDIPELIQNCSKVAIVNGGKLEGMYVSKEIGEEKLGQLINNL